MATSEGWYGRDPTKHTWLAVGAEALGTFFFIFIGIGFAVLVEIYMPGTNVLTAGLIVALGFGSALVLLVPACGHTSGAHFNPAVTVGQCAAGKFSYKYALWYVAVQCLGTYFAVRLVKALYGTQSKTASTLGAPAMRPGMSILEGMLIEGLLTFLLVFVVISVATSKQAKGDPGVAIGFALFVAVFLGSTLTGGAVNPTRALVTIVESGTWELGRALWVYTIGPLAGGILASLAAKALESAQAPIKA